MELWYQMSLEHSMMQVILFFWITVILNDCKSLKKYSHNVRDGSEKNPIGDTRNRFQDLNEHHRQNNISKTSTSNFFKSFQTSSTSKKIHSSFLLQDPQQLYPSFQAQPILKPLSSQPHLPLEPQGCLLYSVQEEQPAGMLVGNVFHDSHISLKHNPDVLKSLKFFFLVKGQKSENLPYASRGEIPDYEKIYSSEEKNQFEITEKKQQKQFSGSLSAKNNTQKQISNLENDESSTNKNLNKKQIFSIGDLFTLEEKTGVLRTKRVIDREEVCKDMLDVCVLKIQVVVQPLK